jgi:trehalose 6-phosphate phosphatase
MVRRERVLICLDFDGTISEIAPEPDLARPVPGAVEVITRLKPHRGRVAVCVVSGRDLQSLRSVLPLPGGIPIAGIHGLELVDEQGKYKVGIGARDCYEDFSRTRNWLDENVPPDAGFLIEDKGLSIALHYRNVQPHMADYVRDLFERFIVERTATLKPRHGKMVVEALPKIASKANAVRAIRQDTGPDFVPVYFGDDLTDEDAFTELGAAGIGVLVGAPRPSAAKYIAASPADVIAQLEAVAVMLENPEPPDPETDRD